MIRTHLHPASLFFLLLVLIPETGPSERRQGGEQAIAALLDRVRRGELLENSTAAEIRVLAAQGVDPLDAIQAIKPYITNENIIIRFIAGGMIWDLDRTGTDVIFEALSTEDPRKRAFIVQLLGVCQYQGSSHNPMVRRRFLEAFTDAIHDESVVVRRQAARALSISTLPSEDRLRPLLAATEDPDLEVKIQAMLTLISFLPNSQVFDERHRLQVGEEDEVRKTVLARLSDEISSKDPSRIYQAVDLVGHLRSDAQPLAQDLAAAWSSVQNDVIRNRIRHVLKQIAPGEQLLPSPPPSAYQVAEESMNNATLEELRLALRTGDQLKQRLAAKAMAAMESAAAPALQDLIETLGPTGSTADPYDDFIGRARVVDAVSDAILAIGPPLNQDAVQACVNLLYESRSSLRISAVSALAKLARLANANSLENDILPSIVRMLTDHNYRVRDAAAASLGELGATAAPVLPRLLEFYEAGDPGVRQILVFALHKIAREAAFPLLVEGLTEFPNAYYRAKCAQTLGQYGASALPAVPALVHGSNHGEQWADEPEAARAALLRIVGRPELLHWLQDQDAERRRAAATIFAELGTEEDLVAIADLKKSGDANVAAAAESLERSMRHRLFNEPRDKTLTELVDDFREDNIPGNAERAWRSFQRGYHPKKFEVLEDVLTNSTDAQQRKMAALYLAANSITPPTEEILELVIDNLRAGSLGLAVPVALEWLIKMRLPDDLKEKRTELLRRALNGRDSQMARLAALTLQYDSRYEPTLDELILLAENLEDDGIVGNAKLALDVLERLDYPGKRERMEQLLQSGERQAVGRAALALLNDPSVEMTPDLLRGLIGNLAMPKHSSRAAAIRSIELIGQTSIPEKREYLEEALQSRDNPLYRRRAADLLLAMPDYSPSDAMIEFLIDSQRTDKLITFRSPQVISRLEKALDSTDRQHRLWAADALPPLHEYPGDPPPRLIPVLFENLEDEDYIKSARQGRDFRSYYNAKDTAVYLMEHPELATSELEASLDSPDAQRRWLSAFVLGVTGRGGRIDRIAEILLPELRVDGNAWMAGYALKGLGKDVRPYLEPYVNDRDPELRQNIEIIFADLEHPPKTSVDLTIRARKFRLRYPKFMVEPPTRWWGW